MPAAGRAGCTWSTGALVWPLIVGLLGRLHSPALSHGAGTVRIKDHQAEQRMLRAAQRDRGRHASALLALVLVGRLVVLQIVRYDYYLDLSQGNRTRIEPIPANRGLILDRNGEVLAENQPSYQLELVREQVPDLEVDAAGPRRRIGLIPEDEIDDTRRLIRSRRGFEAVPIRLRLTEEEIARFAVHRHQFPGVDIRDALDALLSARRARPCMRSATWARSAKRTSTRIDRSAYAGTSLIGKLGVEAARETELHGENGFREILVNAQGRSVQKQGGIEPNLQHAAADGRLGPDPRARPARAAGRRGRLRGPARRGHRDRPAHRRRAGDGERAGLRSEPLRPRHHARASTASSNPASTGRCSTARIRGTYPPGSTVKPVLGMAGLAYGVITPNETRFCPGVYRVPGSRRIAREGRGGVHGTLDLRTAIAESCDVYFYGLAVRTRRRPHARVPRAIRLRQAHRHRHRRRADRHPAVARMEAEALHAIRRTAPGIRATR